MVGFGIRRSESQGICGFPKKLETLVQSSGRGTVTPKKKTRHEDGFSGRSFLFGDPTLLCPAIDCYYHHNIHAAAHAGNFFHGRPCSHDYASYSCHDCESSFSHAHHKPEQNHDRDDHNSSAGQWLFRYLMKPISLQESKTFSWRIPP